MAAWLMVLFAAVLPDGSVDCVALQFTSKNCSACRSMQGNVDALADYGWAIRQVDVDQNPAMAMRYNITQIPTTLVLRRGSEVDRIVGPLPAADVHNRLVVSGQTAGAAYDPSAPQSQIAGNPINGQSFTSTGSANSRVIRGQSLGQFSGSPNETFALANATNSSAGGFATFGQPTFRNGGVGNRAVESHGRFTTTAVPTDPNLSGRRAPNRAYVGPSDPAASTVRIRVDDPRSQSIGTGTIIDTHDGEALVITCGHLFRDLPNDARILIEYWVNGQMMTSEGSLVDFTAEELDIGLVAFRRRGPIATSPVLPADQQVREGEAIYSFGCDSGQNPSRRDSRVTKLNRYLGPQNIEIAGAPIQGRSGGGLFNAAGYLIGICYAKDDQRDEGLYSGPSVIYDQLNKFGLEHLTFQSRSARR